LACASCGPAVIVSVAAGGGGGGSQTPPVRPSSLSAQVEGPRRIDLAWLDRSTDELGFRVERQLAGGSSFEVVARLAPETPGHSDTTVEPRTTYVYRVVAFNGGGETLSETTAAVTTPAHLGVLEVVPDSGLTTGGELLRLRGAGFSSQRPNTVPMLTLAGATVVDLRILGDDAIEFVAPGPTAAGRHALSLSNGYETAQLPEAFTCFGSPPAFAPNDRRINASIAGVATTTDPEICCSGSSVYVVWQDTRNGPRHDIAFNRSVDGGVTWEPNDRRIDTDAAGAAQSEDPELACCDDAVYAVWSDGRNGQRDVYCNRSLDGGATWLSQDVRLDGDAPGMADSTDPEIACSGDHVYVTWWDNRNGVYDVWFNRSLDRGTTWMPAAVRLDTDPGLAHSGDPRIVCDGDRVYVTWIDARNGGFDIYFNRSLDAGATWLGSDVRLNGGGVAFGHRLCASEGHIVVVWHDSRSGNLDIHYNHSSDDGGTWMPADGRLDTDAPGAAGSTFPQIACSGAAVYVAWFETRGADHDVYFNRSLDRGVTWLAADVRVPDGGAVEIEPALGIAANGPQVQVVWSSAITPSGLHDVVLGSSGDAGATWTSTRVDRGAFDSRSPQLCASSARLYVAWRDSRDGSTTPGLYFNQRVP